MSGIAGKVLEGSLLSRILLAPAVRYNRLLESDPIKTKCATSALLSGCGDVIAQRIEHHQRERRAADETSGAEAPEKKPFVWDRKRTAVMFSFGFCSGFMYHGWFGVLDELPAAFLRLRQHKARREIIQAYYTLKRAGINVDAAALDAVAPVKPLTKLGGKMLKIAADQIIFSSLFNLIVFVFLGLGNGAADRAIAEYKAEAYRELESDVHDRIAHAGSGVSADTAKDAAKLEAVLHSITEQQEKEAKDLSWEAIWERTWEKTKAVYVKTYLADCAVWPLLQSVNFSLPLKYQVLFVNCANLGWYSFLSYMGGKH